MLMNFSLNKKKYCLILALAAMGCAQAETVTQWVDGVDQTYGWTDYNKANPNDNTDGDNYLCWAAAASNVINWWQKQYSASTAAAPQGEEIWSIFKSSVREDAGGNPFMGFQWWLTGQYSHDDTNGQYAYYSGPKGETPVIENNTIYGSMPFEGFYRESSLPDNDLNYYPWNYELSQFMTYTDVGSDIPVGLGFTVAEALNLGAAATLSLNNFKNEGHAVTLWGVDYDSETQDLTGLWLTDSDDLQYGLNKDGLFHVNLKETEVNVTVNGAAATQTYLTFDVQNGDWYYKSEGFTNDTLFIDSVQFFNTSVSDSWGLVYHVPEPATATLSLLALAGLAARRRR